ncbi:MAG TPA: hypothetical protein VFJ30_15920 [Phycisphaerae bacterium]|nr:hypothetical protein [Phycisphaerae bacterium]
MSQDSRPTECHRLTEYILSRAAALGLVHRKITNLKGWRSNLDSPKNGQVAAQVHEVSGKPGGRALVVGSPGEDWPGPGPFEQIPLEDFAQLSGDFDPNKNWLRGIRNFDRLNPAKAVFVPHALLNEPANGHMRQHLEVLLRYAAQHRH